MGLPITKKQCQRATKWIKSNFGEEVSHAVRGTPFSEDNICAIICQETAYFWLQFLDTLSVDDILKRCILDASGDSLSNNKFKRLLGIRTKRSAFPKNTNEFRKKYGIEKTNILIEEANRTKMLRGMGSEKWVYKGYGIFQYDLQYVQNDPDFFFQKQWYDFATCLKKVMMELEEKFRLTKNVKKAIEKYNGSGPKAREYAENVMLYTQYCEEI